MALGKYRRAVVVCLLGASLSAHAAEERMTRKANQRLPFVLTAAIRTPEPPKIDGNLDDACWQRAGEAKDFVVYGGRGYATEKTEALALWDANNLYLGVRCFDSDLAKLKTDIMNRDGEVFSDDCVEIFFIPPGSPVLQEFPESVRYFHLIANSRGVAYDEVGMSAPAGWDATWQCKASVHSDRWELEIAFPFEELKTRVSEGAVWAINFNRAQQAKKEFSGWSITFAGFHDPTHFGRMVFLKGWPQRGVKELGPAIEARAVRTYELDPLLPATMKRLEETETALRSLLGKSSLPVLATSLKEVLQAKDEASLKWKNLQSMNPTKLVSAWEQLKAEYERFDRACDALSARGVVLAGLSEGQLAGKEPLQEFIGFTVPAITNNRLLPNRLPPEVKNGQPVELTACPGEYESGSFGIYAMSDLKAVRVQATDLQGERETIPSSALDLRVVKVWYQAGRNVGFLDEHLLTPELLLKDDSLVEVDFENKCNVLKMDKDAMRDADELQPVNLAKATAKQFWVTVHVPAGTPAGDYSGTIAVTPEGKTGLVIPIRLRVLPFKLAEPKQICSIYYRGVLRADKPICTSEAKTEEQMLAELKDMVAHGVTNPNVYQGPDGQKPDGSWDLTLLQRVFELRKQAGMVGGPLMILGVGVGSPPSLLKATIDLARKNGFSEVYFYGADEASDDALRAERADFEKVHKAGGKIFVAGYLDSFEIVGDLLDMPVFSGRPNPPMGQAYHALGHRILSYGNPQGGVEEPETYRRNYGLALWKAGYDGASTYAYQHSFGHAWDDYDDPTYRDHNMAYPTVNGVIPTVEWEGYREGYDDLRYLATLENYIEQAKQRGGQAAELARKAQLWLLGLQPEKADLEDLRKQIREYILGLMDVLVGRER